MSWSLLFFAVSCSVLGSCQLKVPLSIVILDDGEMQNSMVLELAASLINNSSSILPGHHLQLPRREGWCGSPPAPGLAPFPVAEALWGTREEEDPAIVGVIGPTCSSSALFLGSLLERDDSSPVSIHMAESHLLENRERYPKSFGIVGSSSLLLHASIQLIRMNNWTKVNVLYDESHLYHSSSLYNTDESLRDSFTIREYFVSSLHLTYIPLNESKRESRITFLFMSSEDLVRKVLCLAYHSGVTFPAYQFVIGNVNYTEVINSSITFNHNRKWLSCSVAKLTTAFSGAVYVTFSDRYTSINNTSWNLTIEDQLPEVNRQTFYYLDELLALATIHSLKRVMTLLVTQYPSTRESVKIS